jgi:hypothetical protein
MSMDYTQQKLWEAVNILIGTGSLQTRLGDARSYLAPLDYPFPGWPGLQARLENVKTQLLENLSHDDDAEKAAHEIVSLLLEATRLARTPVGVTEALTPPTWERDAKGGA